MPSMLHRNVQMNSRTSQARPVVPVRYKSLQRIQLKHAVTCNAAARPGAEAHTRSQTAGAPPAVARSEVRLRGGLASVALAACLALQLPTGPVMGVARAEEGGGMVAEAAAVAAAASGSEAAAVAGAGAGPVESGAGAGLQTVYFGNGCFWGRQKDFVDVEMQQLGRAPEQLTALVGYAAGTRVGPDGKVCYVYSDPRTHYDALGHAEVVQLGVSNDPRVAESELRAFAARYFQQFKKTPGGMQRSDPQDLGPAYRNVIGIPGGVNSPFFPIIQVENKYGMELREGRGNVMGWAGPTEDDILNTVWVVDSAQLPFYRAERYHQFHNGLGKKFAPEYVRDLRNLVAGLGRIEPTGCPELPF